jgi:TATA-binding protein-associated factor
MILSTPAELERARKEAKTRLGLDFLDADDDPDHGWTQELMEEATDVTIVEDGSSIAVKSPDSKMDAASPGHSTTRTDEVGSPMSVDVTYAPIVRPNPPSSIEPRQHAPVDPLESPTSGHAEDMSALSARERNRLKRKRRQEETGSTAVISRAAPATAPPAKWALSPIIKPSPLTYSFQNSCCGTRGSSYS